MTECDHDYQLNVWKNPVSGLFSFEARCSRCPFHRGINRHWDASSREYDPMYADQLCEFFADLGVPPEIVIRQLVQVSGVLTRIGKAPPPLWKSAVVWLWKALGGSTERKDK